MEYKFLFLFLFFIFLVSIPLIYAQENNQTDNQTVVISPSPTPTCERNDTIKIFKEVMNATEIEQYIREVESIQNNCSLDYIRGKNCPAAWLDLADHNSILASKNDDLLKEVGRLEGFKIGFYIFSVLLSISAIILIIKSFRK